MPSTAASALRSAGQWSLDGAPRRFDAEDWWYRLQFDSAGMAPAVPAVLGFDGLATVADVWLNGQHILASDNMFRAYQCDVTALLRADNELVIRFSALDTLLAARRPRPRWRAPMIENQQLRWFRTTVLGRTPGWSPPAAAVGPWRSVWLALGTAPFVDALQLQTQLVAGQGIIAVSLAIAGLADPVDRVELVLTCNGTELSVRLDAQTGGRYAGRLQIPNPELWWPHTHGEAALYAATVRVRTVDRGDMQAELGVVAFRSVSLTTTDGNFSVMVNGVRVFCRGACWTPLDPVSLHVDQDAYRAALTLVREAGMNMLRVGGTMVYEHEHFYRQCDAQGILVWQDFMFANMDYPETDQDFLASVTIEAEQILERLRRHPCLAILCGNSEVEQQAAMWGASRDRWSPTLFHGLLAGKSRELCAEVPYWPSSAHGGPFPHAPVAGSASYYGVGAYLRPLEDARRAEVRFASECLAFANVPEPATIRRMPGGASMRVHHPLWKARTPRDLGAGWDFDDVRDHYLAQLFNVDPLQLRYANHDRYLALSRVVSGEVMSHVYGEWRRQRSTCNGGLVWFLRDLWPGAGWGVIGADGLPKAAYYYLRRVLQPVGLHVSDEGGSGLMLHLFNERPLPLTGTLELELYHSGEVCVAREQRPICVPARAALELPAGDLLDGFHDLAYAYRFGPPAYDLLVATLRPDAGSTPATAHYFPSGLSAQQGGDIGLKAHAIAGAGGSYQLELTARAFAQSVVVEADGFRCDDQYFHLPPATQRSLTLWPIDIARSRPLRGTVLALNQSAAIAIDVRQCVSNP